MGGSPVRGRPASHGRFKHRHLAPFLSFFSLAYPKINAKIGAKKSITQVGSWDPTFEV